MKNTGIFLGGGSLGLLPPSAFSDEFAGGGSRRCTVDALFLRLNQPNREGFLTGVPFGWPIVDSLSDFNDKVSL